MTHPFDTVLNAVHVLAAGTEAADLMASLCRTADLRSTIDQNAFIYGTSQHAGPDEEDEEDGDDGQSQHDDDDEEADDEEVDDEEGAEDPWQCRELPVS